MKSVFSPGCPMTSSFKNRRRRRPCQGTFVPKSAGHASSSSLRTKSSKWRRRCRAEKNGHRTAKRATDKGMKRTSRYSERSRIRRSPPPPRHSATRRLPMRHLGGPGGNLNWVWPSTHTRCGVIKRHAAPLREHVRRRPEGKPPRHQDDSKRGFAKPAGCAATTARTALPTQPHRGVRFAPFI